MNIHLWALDSKREKLFILPCWSPVWSWMKLRAARLLAEDRLMESSSGTPSSGLARLASFSGKVPSISSTESEFYSLSSCVAMSVHLRNMVEEAGFPMDGPMSIMCDSRGARMLAKHNRSTPRTRHLHRRWFFVTHYERTEKVKVEEVSSEGNWSNVLTKPLGVTAFWIDCGRLGLMNTW